MLLIIKKKIVMNNIFSKSLAGKPRFVLFRKKNYKKISHTTPSSLFFVVLFYKKNRETQVAPHPILFNFILIFYKYFVVIISYSFCSYSFNLFVVLFFKKNKEQKLYM